MKTKTSSYLFTPKRRNLLLGFLLSSSCQVINAFQPIQSVSSGVYNVVKNHPLTTLVNSHTHSNSNSNSNTKIKNYEYLFKSSSSSTTALNVKFRLDNDEEEGEGDQENEYQETKTIQQKQQQQLDNDDSDSYYKTAPPTTFGAEAVPEAQRPANEYMELLSSPLFGWANRTPNGDQALLTRLLILYISLFTLVCWPITGATFTMSGYEIHQFISSNIGAFGFVLVIVLRLYTGWGYVASRLQSKQIEYEETGW